MRDAAASWDLARTAPPLTKRRNAPQRGAFRRPPLTERTTRCGVFRPRPRAFRAPLGLRVSVAAMSQWQQMAEAKNDEPPQRPRHGPA